MDLFSYLLGKKAGGGGTGNYNDLSNKPQINNVTLSGNKSLDDLGIIPIQIITDNSSSNPFVFEEHEPGIYFFENTSSASYSVYFKRLTTNTGTFNFKMSMGTYLYYLRKTDSTTTSAVYFACIYDIAINRNNSGSIISAILKFRQDDTKNYGFQEINATIENYNVVGLSNNQTISGTKTFSKIPKQNNTNAPTDDTEFTNKKYVDDLVSALSGGGLKIGELPNTPDSNSSFVFNDKKGLFIRGTTPASVYGSTFRYKIDDNSTSYQLSNTFCITELLILEDISQIVDNTENVLVAIAFGYQGSNNFATPEAPQYEKIYLKPNRQLYMDSHTFTYQLINKADQTFDGIKTFNSFPITPSSAPTTNYQTANKKYVDDKPTTYAGYDATKTQVLKNINGTLTWVDE